MEVPENRRWMYTRINPRTKWVTADFEQGVEEFLAFALRTPYCQQSGTIRCPCVKCKCRPYLIVDEAKVHIYKHGFKPDYYIWINHGEREIESHSPMSPVPGALRASHGPLGNQPSQYKNKKRHINGLGSKAQEIDSTSYSHRSSSSTNNPGPRPDFKEELRTRIQKNEDLIAELRKENQDLRQVNTNILFRLEALEQKLSKASDNNSNAENDERP